MKILNKFSPSILMVVVGIVCLPAVGQDQPAPVLKPLRKSGSGFLVEIFPFAKPCIIESSSNLVQWELSGTLGVDGVTGIFTRPNRNKIFRAAVVRPSKILAAPSPRVAFL